jgi:hypothetical protein
MKVIPSTATHRGKRFIAIVLNDEETATMLANIDGVPYCILQIADKSWILGPQLTVDERDYTDFGPFDTAEQAYAQLRLLGS